MRPLLMIPGPIEVDHHVLAASAQPMLAHGDPHFAAEYARVLARLKIVFGAPQCQPFVLAGGGTLAMEVAALNLLEPNDPVIVVETGVFGGRMADMCERIGARVTRVTAELGHAPPLETVESALRAGAKAITITHVDTSTAVRAPAREIAELARRYDALTILDGVCSVGGEELQQDAWGIDVALTGSQKALAAPPGLALLSLSQRALEALRSRSRRVPSYYLDLLGWLPIMQSYGEGKPAYYATPAVTLIRALEVALDRLTREGVEARAARHKRIARAFRAGIEALGLEHVPQPSVRANTLSAVSYPANTGPELVSRIRDEGVAVATGLHPKIRDTYFRVGHMGDADAAEILTTLGAIERALHKTGALAAAQSALFG